MAPIGRSRPLIRLLLALFAAGSQSPAHAELERSDPGAPAWIELAPDRRAGWSVERLFAPLAGLFLGGARYWYEPRELEISTTPERAALELFYVRANMQRDYEQAEAPLLLRLPARIDSTKRDVVSVRASASGYRTTTIQIPVRSRLASVQIDLEPVANQLLGVDQLYFAGSAVLRLKTRERSTLRVQRNAEGFSLTLLETSLAPEAGSQLGALQSGLLHRARGEALGPDLMLSFESPAAARGEVELRASQDEDPVRAGYELRLSLAPQDGGAGVVRRARQALARWDDRALSECDLVFDRELRNSLDPDALARDLSVYEPFTGRFVRAALRRQGELSPDRSLRLVDGTSFRASVPLELEAASSRAGEVLGLLALLQRLVAELDAPEQRGVTLRSLLAPGAPREGFEAALRGADAAEAACRRARGTR